MDNSNRNDYHLRMNTPNEPSVNGQAVPMGPEAPVKSAAKGHAHARPGMKTLLAWHWISSAICLVGLVLFAVTGITLNHADVIEAKAQRQTWQAVVSGPGFERLRQQAQERAASPGTAASPKPDAPLPDGVLAELAGRWQTSLSVFEGRVAEWQEDEVYVPAPGPGRDRWIRIDLQSGEAEMEQTTRGAVALLNDLHKGRHTGWAWSLFLDVFAVACLVFTLSGLWILQRHAPKRRLVWPLVGAGLVLPALLAMAALHG